MEIKLITAAVKRLLNREKEWDLRFDFIRKRLDSIDSQTIDKVEIKHGELHFFIDGHDHNLGNVIGADGRNGRDGVNGIDGQKGDKGDAGMRGPMGVAGRDGKDGLNGLDGERGPRGHKGLNGANGKDGIGIQDVWIDENGDLIILLSDNRQINAGRVMGRDGVTRVVNTASKIITNDDISFTRVSDDYVVLNDDDLILVDTTSSVKTVYLPDSATLISAIDRISKRYDIKNVGTSSNKVRVVSVSGELLEGSAVFEILNKGTNISFITDGNGWEVI